MPSNPAGKHKHTSSSPSAPQQELPDTVRDQGSAKVVVSNIPSHLQQKPQSPSERRQSTDSRGVILIVHPSRLFRDCLKKALLEAVAYDVLDFSDLEQAGAAVDGQHVVLLLIGSAAVNGTALPPRLDAFLALIGAGVPVVVSGDSEDPKLVVDLLSRGISGYLPTSLDLEVTIHALGLILAGGTFAPAGCLLKLWQSTASLPAKSTAPDSLTSKQLAVIEAIRRGKPNKTIAYELNMCESTVKVHVRNIMKKLKARNRTHVAYLANRMLGHGQMETAIGDGEAASSAEVAVGAASPVPQSWPEASSVIAAVKRY